jgi:hypothetical protein
VVPGSNGQRTFRSGRARLVCVFRSSSSGKGYLRYGLRRVLPGTSRLAANASHRKVRVVKAGGLLRNDSRENQEDDHSREETLDQYKSGAFFVEAVHQTLGTRGDPML